MGVLETIFIILSSSLCLYLVKLLHKIWWTPMQIRRLMSSQGIKGPPYRFIHGNTKEISNMTTESLSKPMDLSHDIFPRVQPHQHSWINTYGRNFINWSGPKGEIVISDPELAKEILTNREGVYPKFEVPRFARNLTGDGLTVSEGRKWAKQQKLANHAFHAESLKNMVPAMIESVEMMLERWKLYEGKEIDVLKEFRMLTSEVISRTAFESSYLEGESIFEKLSKLGVIIHRISLKASLLDLSRLWKSRDDIESDKLEQGIRDTITRIIEKRQKTMREVDDWGNDLLGVLVKAMNDPDENNRITMEDVVDECKTFYMAGHETTSNMLAWVVLLLAIHTDWQDKAKDEALNLKLFDQQLPNVEGLARMKTTSMIINETLRLYPSIANIQRRVHRTVKLGKLVLPANLMLSISTLALHGDPQIWGEDVHLFKPERFSEGVAKATNNIQAAYVPFGFGPRNCVGMNFAMNEAKIAISMILQRYAFTLSPTYTHSPAQILTIRPQHGVQIFLHPL